MKQMQEEMYLKRNEYELYLNLLMSQIVIIIGRMLNGNRRSSDGILYAAKYIRENYGHDMDFKILSESIGYSYDRFRHLFKNAMGISPYSYLLGIRMTNAKRLLKSTDYPVKKIGIMCGYNQPSRFISAFFKSTGVSPLKFRKTVITKEQKPDGDVLNFDD